MKNLLKIVSIIGLTVITQPAYSAAVTDTFATGDTLTAKKLNNIKSAVNDNDTRISDIVLTPGPAGAAGTNGAVGAAGTNGAAGAKGDTGAAGAVGGIGDTGAKGDTGAAGAVGGIGDTGAKGDTGAAGAVGGIGDTGAAGGVGAAGPAGLGAVVFSSAPTVNDDMNSPYSVGTVWIDTSSAKPYILMDSSSGAAVWTVLGGSATGATLYAIGDAGPAGGIVFHVTDGGLHGLEAATVDQVPTQWGCEGTQIAGANGTVVGTGEQNTADIIEFCNQSTAASVAAAYGPGWYLPSKDELNLLHAQKVAGVVDGFASGSYWSSSQGDYEYAWHQDFDDGNQSVFGGGIKHTTYRVRAVRAF
jgi:hypothetical protein